MLQEPEYSYVKGQGWVAASCIIREDSMGRKVRLEFRQPAQGENYMRWFKEYPDPEYIYSTLKQNTYDGFYYRRTSFPLENHKCVVLIPL